MINTDRLSLFTIATGPRGGGKTLLMTSKVCERLLKSYFLKQLKGMDSRVWSNFPVGFNFRSPLEEGKVVHLETLPLNMEAFYTFDDDLTNGWVYIDEIDQWYDRQEWMAVTQRLMNKVITQIRKKKLNLMATIQDISWLNSRGQFQIDIIIGCREAAFSPWGRKMGLDLGEASFVAFKDKSGIMTGYTFDESGRTFNKIFWGKRFWNFYDTDYQFNPLETATKYKLKVPTKVIEVGGQGREDDVGNVGSLRSERKDEGFVLLADIVEELKDSGYESIRKAEFRDLVATKGGRISNFSIDKYLRQLGIGTADKGEYDLLRARDGSPHTPLKKDRRSKVKA